MSNIEEIVYNNILTMIKDNLQILIRNHDSCLYRFSKFCDDLKDIELDKDVKINQRLLTIFTEESLYALLNADFLYDYRDIE